MPALRDFMMDSCASTAATCPRCCGTGVRGVNEENDLDASLAIFRSVADGDANEHAFDEARGPQMEVKKVELMTEEVIEVAVAVVSI